MDLEKIKVSDIVEYNTELGSRCHLLLEKGMNPYSDTEEDIYDALVSSENNEDCLAICKGNSRCGFFYRCFCQGKTPGTSKDPIILQEFEGQYWVKEGKHRVCLAKRTGIEYVDACVEHLSTNNKKILPPTENPGRKVFRATYCRGKVKGEIAVLWVMLPHGTPESTFSHGPVVLNAQCMFGKNEMEVLPGLSYRRIVNKSLLGGSTITAEVKISKDHPNTKIWLYTFPADWHGEIKTIFRCGRWKNIHLQGVRNFSQVPQEYIDKEQT